MFYLRKEPYTQIIPEIAKTDGTIIPERECTTNDRALYKHNQYSRFYRGNYPQPVNTGIHLYQCEKLNTALAHREALFTYCGEWFDVYDENGMIDIPEQKEGAENESNNQ